MVLWSNLSVKLTVSLVCNYRTVSSIEMALNLKPMLVEKLIFSSVVRSVRLGQASWVYYLHQNESGPFPVQPGLVPLPATLLCDILSY